MSALIRESVINCPACGFVKTEIMPIDYNQWFYKCTACCELLRPKPGDCCVFCSYGFVECPPAPQGRDCCSQD